ncbi:MAG: hypothetical protein ACPGCV_03540 [Bacteroidia bacterium]
MEKQQKLKLIVAVTFFLVITGLAVWAYITILLPNKEYHQKTGKKYTQKLEYKTDYNPDYIDSVLESKKSH